jgi:hypothetical protein
LIGSTVFPGDSSDVPKKLAYFNWELFKKDDTGLYFDIGQDRMFWYLLRIKLNKTYCNSSPVGQNSKSGGRRSVVTVYPS